MDRSNAVFSLANAHAYVGTVIGTLVHGFHLSQDAAMSVDTRSRLLEVLSLA
jgi:hypothetical protein